MKRFADLSLSAAAVLIIAGCTGNPNMPEAAPTAPVANVVAAENVNPSSPAHSSHYVGKDRPERMLKLTLKLTDKGIEVIDRIEAPNTVNRRSPDEKRNTFFRIVNEKGEIILERGFRLETVVRSETNGPDGQIQGRKVEIAEPVFSVAIPLYDGMKSILFYEAGSDDRYKGATLLGEVQP